MKGRTEREVSIFVCAVSHAFKNHSAEHFHQKAGLNMNDGGSEHTTKWTFDKATLPSVNLLPLESLWA